MDVHDRVDRLILVVDALWSLLEDGGYSEDQLCERIAQIDAADGTADGKRTASAGHCTEYGSKVPAGRPTCQFCGADVAGADDDPLTGI